MNTKSFQSQLHQTWQSTLRLRLLLFFVLIIVLYGFIGWRINTLVTAQPDDALITSKTSATSKPHIDQAIVDKITQLEDNSVTVQALFNQARQNPFRE
jgi:hypothetical protein